MTKKIKLFEPCIGLNEEESVKKILRSKFWASGAGTGLVSKFEKKFQNFSHSDECVAVNSGTAALHLAISLSDIQNKEVIIPSLSFTSTANSVLYNEGKPIFADVDPNTLCLDPNDVENKITENTKAIIPVHFAGHPSNLSVLQKLAKKHDLIMIEDAAHACGATYEGKPIGSHGKFVCFSFHPVKNLAMPNGGLISINSNKYENLKQKLNSLRWCGISDRIGTNYDVKYLGWNYYMNEFSAGIGLEQLKKLKKLNLIRKNISKRYFEEINISTKMPFTKDSVYHFYWILVKNRKNLIKYLLDKNIETGTHYKPIHKMTYYKSNISLKLTEKFSKQIISLPTHPNLSENDVTKIIKTINSFVR